MPQVTGKDVTKLEKIIDRWQKDLAFLKEFILSGGGEGIWIFASGENGLRPGGAGVRATLAGRAGDAADITFVNRLSDALFVLARWAAKTRWEPEYLWQRDVKKAVG